MATATRVYPPKPVQFGRRPQISTSRACSMMTLSGVAIINGQNLSATAVPDKRPGGEKHRHGGNDDDGLPHIAQECAQEGQHPGKSVSEMTSRNVTFLM